jgi:hypothetical protein
MFAEISVLSRMSERTRKGLDVLEAALLLGVLGDALLRATPWGANLLLWVMALTAAVIALLARWRTGALKGDGRWLLLPLVLFPVGWVWRDSPVLNGLDLLALLLTLGLVALRGRGGRIRLAGLFEYGVGVFVAGGNAALGFFPLVLRDVVWKEIPRAGWSRHALAVARGLMIAVPLLLVFGALFVAADAVFEGLVNKTLDIHFDVLFTHIFLAVFFTWITGGYLRGMLVQKGSKLASAGYAPLTTLNLNDSAVTASKPAQPVTASVFEDRETVTARKSVTDETPDEIHAAGKNEDTTTFETDKSRTATNEKESATTDDKSGAQASDKSRAAVNEKNVSSPFFKMPSLGIIEIGTVLGLLDALFLAFVIVQIRYFFGGAALVQTTTTLTYAEYARRGFFELVTVAALVLPLLLGAHWLLRKENSLHERIFRALAGAQLVLLFVIMCSAVARMRLYQGEYGLTELRLYTTAFMGWLALVFAWFAATVLRGMRERFACGALIAGFVIIGVLHVINPDALIVRVNAAQAKAGRAFDASYTAHLSADAAPALLEAMPSLKENERCVLASHVLNRWATNERADWRTWNWSRAAAMSGARANAATLREYAACSAQNNSDAPEELNRSEP